MYKIFIGLLLSITMVSCHKEKQEEVNGIIKDFTGLDGCGMMIVLDDGQRLEIVSLPGNTLLIADRRVAISYEDIHRMSICMAGITAKITSLRYL